jgi:hypothetical protein
MINLYNLLGGETPSSTTDLPPPRHKTLGDPAKGRNR